MSRRRQVLLMAGAGLFALAALAMARPHADLEILTHRPGDMDPARVYAAVDLGIMAVSVLVTWSRQFAR